MYKSFQIKKPNAPIKNLFKNYIHPSTFLGNHPKKRLTFFFIFFSHKRFQYLLLTFFSQRSTSSNTFSLPSFSMSLKISSNQSSFSRYLSNSDKSSDIIYEDQILKDKINEGKFSAISLNIRSLTKHIENLRGIVSNIKPDIISLSEVFKPHPGFVSLDNYHRIIMKLRPHAACGGVGIYIHKKFSNLQIFDKISNLSLKKIEAIAVKVQMDHKDIVVVSLYRPPETKMNDSLEDLERILGQLENEEVIISGDININLMVDNYFSQKYLDKLLSHNLTQTVISPTRITPHSCTLIDHVISNIPTIQSFTTHHCLSDHQMVLSVWGKPKHTLIEPDTNSLGSHKKLHYEKTNSKIFKVDWKAWVKNQENKDTDETYNSFHDTIQECLVYEREREKINRKKSPLKPWMTNELLNQKRKLDISRKKFLKTKTETNEKEFKKLKNLYNKSIDTAKNDYFGYELMKANKNSKQMWRIINEILQRKSKTDNMDKITHNGKDITNKKEIAEILSNYYKHAAVDKINKINSKNNYKEFLDIGDKRNNTFNLRPMEKGEVWSLIKNIKPKCSAGFDNVATKVMVNGAQALLLPLTAIINKCFQKGQFPKKLKTSKICPIFKKGEHIPKNFRPVALQSCFSKIIEAAAVSQMIKHNEEQFDDQYQFAYKKNHSCLHPIILTRNEIEKETSRKKYVTLLLVDLSAAFDTIDVGDILPNKLNYYGADEKTTNFFRSYFCNRKHFAEWKGVSSESTELFNYSCVQGSILGPQTYNFYTMDMKNVSESLMLRFADDTNGFESDRDVNNLIRKTNKKLEKIVTYLDANKLLINKVKLAYMLFKPKGIKHQKITEKVMLGDQEVLRVPSARFLGIFFDENMTFNVQFKELKDKLQEGIKALLVTRKILNYKAKLLLYHGAFKSHLDYCAVAYFDKLNKKQMDEIIKLQKQAIRLVFSAPKWAHTNPLFKLSNITPVTELYKCEAIKLVFKNMNELSRDQQPRAVRDLITKTMNERSKFNEIRIPAEYKMDHCLFNILNTWNEASEDYKMSGNYWILKQALHEDIIDNLELCEVKNCWNCQNDKKNYEKYCTK